MKHRLFSAGQALPLLMAVETPRLVRCYTQQYVPDPVQHYPSRSSQGPVSINSQVPDSEGNLSRHTTKTVSTMFGKRFGWGFGNLIPYTGGLTGDLNTVVNLDNTSTLNRVATVIGNQLSSGILGKSTASPTAHDEAIAGSKSVFIPQKRNANGSGTPGVMKISGRIACHDLTHNGWYIGFKTPATLHLLVAAAANQITLQKAEAANTYLISVAENTNAQVTVAVTPATVPVVDIEDTWELTAECGTLADGSDSILEVRQNGKVCVLTATNLAAAKLAVYNLVVTTPPILNACFAEVNLDGTQRAGVSFTAVLAEAD